MSDQTKTANRPETGNPVTDELTCWLGAKYKVNAVWHDEGQWSQLTTLTEKTLANLAANVHHINFIEIFQKRESVCLCDYRTIN